MIGSMATTKERIGWVDVAITVLFSGLGILLMAENVADPKVQAPVAAIPVFLLVTIPLLWRRVAPMQAMGAVLAAWLVHAIVFGSDIVRCGVLLPTVLILGFSAGARLELREARIALLLGFGAILGESITFFGAFGVVMAGVLTAVWYSGRIARSRTKMAGELKERTAELREARDRRAQLEVAADRARVAAELDELLQRRLGALARLADEGATTEDAAGATATLQSIERESRRTLEEMRAVVGVLRHDDDLAPTTPQPTLTHLDAMLVRAKGADARLKVEGSPRAAGRGRAVGLPHRRAPAGGARRLARRRGARQLRGRRARARGLGARQAARAGRNRSRARTRATAPRHARGDLPRRPGGRRRPAADAR
jgi:hypothetical protein